MIKITSVGAVSIVEYNDDLIGQRVNAIYDGVDAISCSPCDFGEFKTFECNVKFNGE